MKPFKVANFRRTEPKALQITARELAHGLHTRTSAELASVRGELAAISTEAKDDYTRGFLDAIEHLLAGYSAETKHRAALAEDASRLRKNAIKVLVSLHAGMELPKDIARNAKLTMPAVSVELQELEREGFVERAALGAGQDQRNAPRTLTSQGARLAYSLSQESVTPTAEAARDLAPIFISCIASLTDQSYLGEQSLREIAVDRLGKISGAYVWNEFLQQARRQQLISESPLLGLSLTSLHFGQKWSDVLQTATRSRHQLPRALEHVRELSISAEVQFRVTAAMFDQCDLAFRMHRIKNIRPWCIADARADQLPKPQGRYHIVWSSPDVLARDLENDALRELVQGAWKHHCYAAPDSQLPPNVERLDLDANYVTG